MGRVTYSYVIPFVYKYKSNFINVCHMKFDEKNIIDFEVTRSSLEQVFVSFAKHQIEQQP